MVWLRIRRDSWRWDPVDNAPVHVVSAPLTLEQYLAMPDEGNRYEVVDGQPVMVPAPINPHQRAITRLLTRFDAVCPPGYEPLASPIDWVLWEVPTLHVRQPDVVVLSSDQASTARITEPPLLVVEVLSPESVERDVVAKRTAYAQAGAQHYWIVDLSVPEVVMYTAEAGRLVETRRARGDDRVQVTEPFPVSIRAADLVGPRPHA